MPTPKPNESQKDFVSRCVPMVMNEGTTKDQKQAVAICYSMFRQHHEKMKSDLTEFSLTVLSTGLNKTTGERYWKASASDTKSDLYNDEMSMELYRSFMDRIESEVRPPEPFCNDFWEGGLPYVSVSHYRETVAGDTNKLYVDGDVLKAAGTFRDTPLGKACFESLCDDLYKNKSKNENRIRVSIAFLDYKHKHKSNDFVFERSETNTICPECAKEAILDQRPGRIFLDGHLIHLAMTRVPVNGRTLMEVEKSMTTRKEDAESIIGPELAEEIEKKESEFVGKSEALVIKADDETPVVEPVVNLVDPAVEKPKVADPILDRLSAMEKILSDFTSRPAVEEPKATHPLDAAIMQLRSDFDSILLSEASADERLKQIQGSFNALGVEIQRQLSAVEAKSTAPQSQENSLVLDAIQKLSDRLDLLASQQRSQVVVPPTSVPAPRSISPALVPQQQAQSKEQGSRLRSIIDKSVGLG